MYCNKCGKDNIKEEYLEKVRKYCDEHFPGQGLMCLGCQNSAKGQKEMPQSAPQSRTERPSNARSDFESDVMAKMSRIIELLEKLAK